MTTSVRRVGQAFMIELLQNGAPVAGIQRNYIDDPDASLTAEEEPALIELGIYFCVDRALHRRLLSAKTRAWQSLIAAHKGNYDAATDRYDHLYHVAALIIDAHWAPLGAVIDEVRCNPGIDESDLEGRIAFHLARALHGTAHATAARCIVDPVLKSEVKQVQLIRADERGLYPVAGTVGVPDDFPADHAGEGLWEERLAVLRSPNFQRRHEAICSVCDTATQDFLLERISVRDLLEVLIECENAIDEFSGTLTVEEIALGREFAAKLSTERWVNSHAFTLACHQRYHDHTELLAVLAHIVTIERDPDAVIHFLNAQRATALIIVTKHWPAIKRGRRCTHRKGCVG